MLTASEAAQLMKADESVIYRLAESGELHFAATTEGILLICPDSLLAFQSDEQVRPSQKLLITEGEVSAD